MGEPVDPDVDLSVPDQRAELVRSHGAVLAVVAAGGALGALARYGLTLAWPHRPRSFPWATFAVNVSGCLLIGALMALVGTVWAGRRLARPFLGTGVLGGFTTFSTYTVDFVTMVRSGAAPAALAYLVGTLGAAVLAAWLGHAVTHRLAGP